MQAERFNKYLEDCFKGLLDSYGSFVKDGDDKQLFRFRVSIKKIRVCIACLEYYHGKRKTGIRHRLRNYFHKGGAIREMYLYEDWLSRHQLRKLLNVIGLEKITKKDREDFVKDASSTIEAFELIKKQLIEEAEKISQEQVYQFYVELIITNLPLPMGHPPKSKWHAMRKNIKRVRYARKWQEDEGLGLVSQRQSVFLDLLQRYFGKWHDNEVLKEWMQKKAKEHKEENCEHLFQKAIAYIKSDSDKFIERARQLLERASAVLLPLANRLAQLQMKKNLLSKSSKLLRAT